MKWLFALAVVGLLATSTLITGAAPRWSPTGPTLVTGRVTSRGSGGGLIAVFLQDMSDAGIGVEVELVSMNQATLGTDGRFIVRPVIDEAIRSAMDEKGRVELLVTGDFGGRGFHTSISRVYDRALNRWTTTDGRTSLAVSIEADQRLTHGRNPGTSPP